MGLAALDPPYILSVKSVLNGFDRGIVSPRPSGFPNFDDESTEGEFVPTRHPPGRVHSSTIAMNHRGWRIPALSIALALVSGPSGAEGPRPPAKKILVEVYTSQGSRTSPPVSDLLGRFAKMGYGPDKVVALNFHLDTANDPWVDPFSDPAARRRQLYYNDVLGRRDLMVSPLTMVDGHESLVGSDRSTAQAALERAGHEEPEVSLDLILTGTGTRRSLSVRLSGRSPDVTGRDLIVGVALAEDSITTRVKSGENAGRMLVEHHVVRRFDQKSTRVAGPKPRSLTFPVEMVEARGVGTFRVAAFVQDRLSGRVYQADSIAWPPDRPAESVMIGVKDHPKTRRRPAFTGFDPMASIASGSADQTPSCPDCGTPYSPEFLASQPPLPPIRTRGRSPNLPLPSC